MKYALTMLTIVPTLAFASTIVTTTECNHEDDYAALLATDWAEMLIALELLEHGSATQKLALYESDYEVISGPFDALGDPPGCDDERVARTLDQLHRYVRTEDDAWLLDRLAGLLALWGFDEAMPLFASLARHRAPSLRARVVQYAAELDDESCLDVLLDLWSRETVNWLRVEILEEAASCGWDSDRLPYDDCRRLIEDPDPELAVAAIHCVAESPEPRATAALLRRAGSGPTAVQLAALEVLGAWWRGGVTELAQPLERLWRQDLPPDVRRDLLQTLHAGDSPLALSIARRMLREGDEAFAVEAVRIVTRSAEPADNALLMETASHGAPRLRANALGILDTPVLSREAQAILGDAISPGNPTVVRATAVSIIGRYLTLWIAVPPEQREIFFDTRHDPISSRLAFLPLLDRMATEDPDPFLRETARMVTFVTDPVLDVPDDFEFVSTDPIENAPEPTHRVFAPGPVASVRCMAAPGFEHPEDQSKRIAEDCDVAVSAFFDDGETTWRSIAAGSDGDCWLRDEALVPRESGGDPRTPVAGPDRIFEVDIGRGLAHEVTLSSWFQELEQTGVVALFDEGRNLIGMRLDLSPGAIRRGPASRHADHPPRWFEGEGALRTLEALQDALATNARLVRTLARQTPEALEVLEALQAMPKSDASKPDAPKSKLGACSDDPGKLDTRGRYDQFLPEGVPQSGPGTVG